ncbi:DUF3320 domain-containing protein [Plantibacter sp. Mn2098]|uniref:DUF3320 domain-containing protein n=1 Tax=Plantibacter sp. Mn2098 TaxID=3395266 RepID=UPI003BDD8137
MSVTKRRWWLPGWFRRKKHAPEAIAPTEIDSSVRDAAETVVAEVYVAGPVVAGPVAPEAPAAPAAPDAAAADAAATTVTDPASIPDFTVADDSIVASQALLDDLDAATPVIERLAADVLAVEGPIPTLRLVYTVARKLGFDQIGDTRRQDVAAVITASQTVVDGFVWPAGIDPTVWTGVRRTLSREDRAITEISPVEIANAIVIVLGAAVPAPVERETAIRGTADLLGYGRLGESARRWFDLAISAAIVRGRFIEDDGALRLP